MNEFSPRVFTGQVMWEDFFCTIVNDSPNISLNNKPVLMKDWMNNADNTAIEIVFDGKGDTSPATFSSKENHLVYFEYRLWPGEPERCVTKYTAVSSSGDFFDFRVSGKGQGVYHELSINFRVRYEELEDIDLYGEDLPLLLDQPLCGCLVRHSVEGSGATNSEQDYYLPTNDQAVRDFKNYTHHYEYLEIGELLYYVEDYTSRYLLLVSDDTDDHIVVIDAVRDNKGVWALKTPLGRVIYAEGVDVSNSEEDEDE